MTREIVSSDYLEKWINDKL